MRHIYARVKTFIEQYEERLGTAAFIFGFILDILTLGQVDSLLDNLVLISYLFLAAVGIIFINLYWGGKIRHNFFEKIVLWIPFIIQFAFGGLMSGLVVFYGKSASLLSSWPFLLILFAIFVGNERFRSRYTRLAFQISIFYFLLFLLLIFYVPMLTGRMGSLVFVASGILSLLLIAFFIKLIQKSRPSYVRQFWSNILTGVGIIFISLNILYFANIIPPIPLSLKEISVYQSITPKGSGYTALEDQSLDCRFCIRPKVHLSQNGSLSAYSAIFAPTTLKTGVVHEWLQKVDGKWVTQARVPFSIRGGRKEGFRGYTLKSNVTPGLWRVKVRTSSGQVLGRITFEVLPYDSAINTFTKEL